MQNFKIEINDGIYDLFIHGTFLGHIFYSDIDCGYLVYPRDASYTGFFRTLDEAVIELVFHMYPKEFEKIPMC